MSGSMNVPTAPLPPDPRRTLLSALSIGAFLVLTAAVIGAVALTGNALTAANDSLASIDASLTSVGQHADPLTYQITKVNTTLTDIDQRLSPLHGQADNLNGILTGVNDTLTSANASVSSILGHAGPIEASLADADAHLASEAREVGQGQATTRVADLSNLASTVIGLLGPIKSDLDGSALKLAQTNDHLNSACNSLPPPGGC